jgi:hypothetical protein
MMNRMAPGILGSGRADAYVSAVYAAIDGREPAGGSLTRPQR